MAGLCSSYGENRSAYRALGGNSEGNRQTGRHSGRWEDNIKMDLPDMGCGAWTVSIWLNINTGGGHL